MFLSMQKLVMAQSLCRLLNAEQKLAKLHYKPKSLIEHDVRVGDNCHISTRATLNGGAIKNSFIGSSSVIRQNITIGENVSLIQIFSLIKI